MNLQSWARRLPRPLRRHKLLQAFVRMRPRSAQQEIEFNHGARVVVDLRDANARAYCLRREFEPEFFAIADPFLPPGATFFDVGANFGFCTFGLLGGSRGRRVRGHLFEANAELCTLLRRSAALHPHADLTVNHACVTDARGASHLAVMADDWGRSFISTRGPLVPNLRLDDYCRERAITVVDFVKMDIEGHEPRALRGAKDLLAHGRLRAIYLEISSVALARQGHDPAALGEMLVAAGYRLFYCKPEDLAARRGQVTEFRINGQRVPLVELTAIARAATWQTDLLALHRDATGRD